MSVQAADDERKFFEWLDLVAEDLVEVAGDYKRLGGDYPYDGVLDALWRRMCALQGVEPPNLRFESDEPQPWGGAAKTPNRRRAISIRTRLRIYERDGYQCVTCGTNQGLTLDHIHPVSKGGTNDDENLQTMCGPCNSRKGVKTNDDRHEPDRLLP